MADTSRRELILGGQKSGKSRRAESMAQAWLDASPAHRAGLLATARPGDAEMQARIERHQRDRAQRVPGLQTWEEPQHLGAALRQHSTPQTLIVIDCLPLWLTNWLMPVPGEASGPAPDASGWPAAREALLTALADAAGPVVLVSNEIGLGVIPLGAEVRAFVDELGLLNQVVAAACDGVTLMAAGLPLTLKEVGAT